MTKPHRLIDLSEEKEKKCDALSKKVIKMIKNSDEIDFEIAFEAIIEILGYMSFLEVPSEELDDTLLAINDVVKKNYERLVRTNYFGKT